jgi:hypothetical protein
MVSHIPVVAVLMIVQGVLECLAGVLYAYVAFVVRQEAGWDAPAGRMPRGGMPAGGMPGGGIFPLTLVLIVALLVVALSIGILRIIAGITNLKYRGRRLGLAALTVGTLSLFTGYCAPTTIALLVYGLIVYMNEDVRRAFAMGEQGFSSGQIRAKFNRRKRRRMDDDDSWDR